MPPKREPSRIRGVAQLRRPPPATGRASPASQFAPPFSSGAASWQTPVRQPSAASGRGPGPGRGRGRGRGSGRARGRGGSAPATTTAQRSDSTGPGKNPTGKHQDVPELPSSHWLTVRLSPELLRRFPCDLEPDKKWFQTPASPFEPFVTLKIGPRLKAVRHTKEDARQPLAAQSPSPESRYISESPLPSLTPAATSTSASTPGPQTPGGEYLLEQSSGALGPPVPSRGVAIVPNKLPSTKENDLFRRPETGQIARTTREASKINTISYPAQRPQHRPFFAPMAPVKDSTGVQAGLKDVIQNLYEIQSQTHGYVPETADLLVDKITDLAQSLNRLQNLTSLTASPNNPIHQVRIAPEIVDYVDDGRNPDIFTRDFVENVQRGNAVINGKQKAFRDFSEVFAQVLKEQMPDLIPHVDKVMKNAGFNISEDADTKKETSTNGPQNGSTGS